MTEKKSILNPDPEEFRSRREIRQDEALDRQTLRDKRTPQDQIRVLDTRLGSGLGAKKEREILNNIIMAGEAESMLDEKVQEEKPPKKEKFKKGKKQKKGEE